MQPLADHYVRYIEKLHREGFSKLHISKITRISRGSVSRYVDEYKRRQRIEMSQNGSSNSP